MFSTIFKQIFKFRRFNIKLKSYRNFSNKAEVTALYDFHLKNGGKMVNFGGYLLPVQYSDLGISASHLHTRRNASLFDVSHMLQTEVIGKDCVPYLESICTADLENLQDNQSALTVLTNDYGGILDDLIITKINNEHLYVVSNAAMKRQDQAHLLDTLNNHKNFYGDSNIKIQFFTPEERSLLALQGPKSSEILQKLTEINLNDLNFMTSTVATVCGVDSCRVTRCGYTGEDGFEISIPSIKSVDIANEILKDSNTKLAGLGARDSLRLEAGLCLYGSDISQKTTPIEANLTWLVAKRRRVLKNFPGTPVILKQIKDGDGNISKRIGLISESGPPARHDTPIVDGNGTQIGKVTSGCPSPSLKKNIAMGYVPKSFSKIGTKLNFRIRDKLYEAVVTKMPFVPTNYYNKSK